MTHIATFVNFCGLIVSETRLGTTRDKMLDPLGSVIGEYNDSQTVTGRTEYWPYGEIASETGTLLPSPLKFVGGLGYFRDRVATFLTYIRARWYYPWSTRWTTVDPLWPGESAYGYVENDPIIFADKMGTSIVSWAICKGAGATTCCRRDGQVFPPPEHCCDCATSAGFGGDGKVRKWCKQVKEWENMEPPTPNIKALLCLRKHLNAARDYAKGRCPAGNDKCMHCMTSCYLAQKCGKNTATYAGWCKELQDLTDCKKSGVFDPADDSANRVGINGSGKSCLQACSRFGAR